MGDRRFEISVLGDVSGMAVGYTPGNQMSSPDPTPSSTKAPWYVWLSLIAAVGIFVVSSLVIYYKFMTTPDTNCIIVVTGNKDLDGVEVVVEKVTASDDKLRLADTFSKENKNSLRFFLTSGTYKIDVWSRQKLLLATYPDEFVPPGSRLSLDLGRLRVPSTQPFDYGNR